MNRRKQVGEHRCGRRGGIASTWPTPDHWELGSWAATREEADEDQAEWMAKHPTGSMGDTLWPGPGEMARTCSYCGGVHPDDAARLVREGWKVVPTDKSYKRYLEPADYPEHAPIPPVKVYVQHFSDDQIAAFNAAVGVVK